MVNHFHTSLLNMDECLVNPCYNDGTCSNTIGSFICTRSKGFEGNGENCQGIEN